MLNETDMQQLVLKEDDNSTDDLNQDNMNVIFSSTLIAGIAHSLAKFVESNPELAYALGDAGWRSCVMVGTTYLLETPLTKYMRARRFSEKTIAGTVMALKMISSGTLCASEGTLLYNAANVAAYNVVLLMSHEYFRIMQKHCQYREQVVHFKAAIIATFAGMLVKGQLDAQFADISKLEEGIDRFLIALTSTTTSGLAQLFTRGSLKGIGMASDVITNAATRCLTWMPNKIKSLVTRQPEHDYFQMQIMRKW